MREKDVKLGVTCNETLQLRISELSLSTAKVDVGTGTDDPEDDNNFRELNTVEVDREIDANLIVTDKIEYEGIKDLKYSGQASNLSAVSSNAISRDSALIGYFWGLGRVQKLIWNLLI